MKLLFIDVETTGTDSKKHGIIQLSGAIQCPLPSGDYPAPEYFNFLMAPFKTDEIEDSALEANGISREDLKDPSRLGAKAGKSLFTGMLMRHVSKYNKHDKFFLVGYNAHFDDEFVRRLFDKCGDKYYGSLVCWPPIDVAVMAALKLGRRRLFMPDFKLASLVKEAGIAVEPGRLHDAEYDIYLTMKLFEWCREAGKR